MRPRQHHSHIFLPPWFSACVMACPAVLHTCRVAMQLSLLSKTPLTFCWCSGSGSTGRHCESTYIPAKLRSHPSTIFRTWRTSRLGGCPGQAARLSSTLPHCSDCRAPQVSRLRASRKAETELLLQAENELLRQADGQLLL
jgi:hypothetical protein